MVLQVEEVVMQLVQVMVKMMLLITMASKVGEGLGVLPDQVELQVDAMLDVGKVVVGTMVEEGMVIHQMITMTTDPNTEIGISSGCTM